MRPAEHAARLSEARRALLEKYLRGEMERGKTRAIPKRRAERAPLSYSQQQIWLHSQLARPAAASDRGYNGTDGSLIYNEPITIHRHGELNIPALERSFLEIVRRHEAWRTTFDWEADEAVQIVGEAPSKISIPCDDLRSHSDKETEALRLATEDARRPFDLSRGPMYRLRLVRLDEKDYRLFITLHHIIFDGVSLYRVFLPELLTFYEAFANRSWPAFPDLPIQYSDYALWQRESPVAPEHLSYWESVLRDLPALELKTDRPRPAAQTYAGAMEKFEIPASTAAKLKAFSQEQNATVFMTMTAAFMRLLQNITGQEDIIIGGISSGRRREETMSLLGCFLNTVPIRCAFSEDLPFTDVLARARDSMLGALAHDEIPFELLVQKFAHHRDRAPLVQALIVVEPPLDPLPHGWEFSHMDVDTGTTKFDLQLGLDDRADGLRARFIYNTDLFDRATVLDLKKQWIELLDQIVTPPPMPPLEWSGRRTHFPRKAAIHELFEGQVRRAPAADALVFGETIWSYDQLNRAANRLARRLQKLGVTRDVPVGVLMERSPEMVMALLGVLKAGGAYVPLDPSYPAERLAFMVNDTQMPVILTHKNLGTGTHRSKRLQVDTELFSNEDDSDLATEVRAEDLAYIIYTSGSTGIPKGVAVPHRAVVRLVKNTDYLTFSEDETFLQLAPISFDASALEIWGALLHGGKLAIMRAAIPTLKEIGQAVRDYGVTTLALTSGLFNAMVDEQLEDLRSLRQLLTGGDVISTTHAAKAVRALKSVRLINGYGPTESATLACCHTIEPGDLDGSTIPIGKPIANTSVLILDENLQPVPVGVTGELCIGGDGLARGYWRRDELTVTNFVSDGAKARFYRTGDLARWRSDGTIEFLGRADEQIKLRGFRIEPGEIEHSLKQQPGVHDCVVVLHRSETNEKQLAAFVVGKATANELRMALRKSLPDYMVPSFIVPLPALPQTPSGKVDRNALPAPGSVAEEPPIQATSPEAETSAGPTFALPSIPRPPSPQRHSPSQRNVRPYLGLQVQLIEIWRDLLGTREIGIRDNFFELGGNSLLALRLLHRAEVISGKTVLPAIFFSNPTVEFLATELTRQANEESPPILKVNQSGSRTPFFYLHGDLFGGGFYSSRLSRALGPDRPFYVLPPFDVRHCPAAPSVEEMAAAHLETLRAICPHGPYLVGGFCLGGIVAYELAQQIAAGGERVEMLLLIDAEPEDNTLRLARSLYQSLGRRFKWDEERQLNHFRRCWLRREQFFLWWQADLRTQMRLLLGKTARALNAGWNRVRRKTPRTDGAANSSAAQHRDVFATFLWSAAGYHARKYWGPMTALLSEDLLHRGDHLEDVWRQLAPKAMVRLLKGSHLECITAHVDNLAQTINDLVTPTSETTQRQAFRKTPRPVLTN